MKKNLIPQALAILVGIANAPSSFAMDDPSEQNRNFQSALRHLNDLGEAQKKEADLKAKIEKKTINLETLKSRTEADLKKALQISSDEAKVWAYKIATKLDERSTKRNLSLAKSYQPGEEVPKMCLEVSTFYINCLKNLEKKFEEDKTRQEAESNKMHGTPSQSPFLTFENTVYVGIGQHLFFDIMKTRYPHKKASYEGYLRRIESSKKSSEDRTQMRKEDFIKAYAQLNVENSRKIKEIAEMNGVKLSA